jgi:hypothetical protein
MPQVKRIAVLFALALALAPLPADAQFFGGGGGGRGMRFEGEPDPPKLNEFHGDKFTFATLIYDNNGYDEPLGYGWFSEWPDGGINFMTRLSQLTNIEIARNPDGTPHQVAIRATDPALINYPIVFMTDCGTAGFSKDEAAALRKYLLNGGFLFADDFWGEQAWENFVFEMENIFPEKEYHWRDIPLTHDIFHIVFDVKEIPQIPCIEFWYQTRGRTTSERGEETKTPHIRGIFDRNGRLMVFMSHNTDLQDGWQQEGLAEEYFREFSVKKSYPLGINVVVYAMTH